MQNHHQIQVDSETGGVNEVVKEVVVDSNEVVKEAKEVEKSVEKSDKMERDIVWVDLARIDETSDGITRIASQLHLRHCCHIEELEVALDIFLANLHHGSVVVIDNISFVTLKSEMIAKITPVKKSNSHESKFSLAGADDSVVSEIASPIDWKSFILRFMGNLLKHKDKLNIVIIGVDLSPVRAAVDFTKEITIGPLTSEVAREMIVNYTASTQQVHITHLLDIEMKHICICLKCFLILLFNFTVVIVFSASILTFLPPIIISFIFPSFP
jgi:hypothetical protein